MHTIVTVIGARPQFVKASVVSAALARQRGLQELLVHTGQHYDANMSDVFFAQMGIPEPAYHLGIGSGTHGAQTGAMLRAIEATLMETRPQRVLTFGDTNSTLAATLAAAKLHIPVAHVEAGLRSRNMRMPEEVNRIVSDRLSDILFTPSEDADANLLAEGVAPDRIHRVGDVMFDAARRFAPATMLRRQHILVTIHRPENTESDARMRAICDALDALAAEHRVVFPIHPRTRQAFARLGIAPSSSVQAIDPVGYKDMAKLQAESIVVVTDSGGVQKEAFFHGVPCVTVRDETEWVELLRTGWNRLAPPISAATIIDAVRSAAHGAPATRPILYGDGQAAERIATVLARAADVTPR